MHDEDRDPPRVRALTVHCSCGNEFYTRSTKPELHVEICSDCHPFYTGKQKLVDTGGRVERFNARRQARSKRELTVAGDERRRSEHRRHPHARRHAGRLARRARRRPGGARGRDDARRLDLGGRGSQARRRTRSTRAGRRARRDRGHLRAAGLVGEAPPGPAPAGDPRRRRARRVAEDRLPGARRSRPTPSSRSRRARPPSRSAASPGG